MPVFGGSAGGVRGWVCDCCCGRGSAGEAMVRLNMERSARLRGLRLVEIRDGGRCARGGGNCYEGFIVVREREDCWFENNMYGAASISCSM